MRHISHVLHHQNIPFMTEAILPTSAPSGGTPSLSVNLYWPFTRTPLDRRFQHRSIGGCTRGTSWSRVARDLERTEWRQRAEDDESPYRELREPPSEPQREFRGNPFRWINIFDQSQNCLQRPSKYRNFGSFRNIYAFKLDLMESVEYLNYQLRTEELWNL